jgi:hypothetical protein
MIVRSMDYLAWAKIQEHMLKPATLSLFLSLALALCTGCRKDRDLRRDIVPVLDTFLLLEADSSCIMVPNILTSNGDGINDRLLVFGRHMQELDIAVTDLGSGQVLFLGSTPHAGGLSIPIEAPVADDPPGRLEVQVQGTTTSGVGLSGTMVVHVVGDLATHCVSGTEPAVFGDQLDPRICSIPYPTNDGVCFQ